MFIVFLKPTNVDYLMFGKFIDDDDDINDDSILDILNELHNDSLNGQDEDLDNSMLHASIK